MCAHYHWKLTDDQGSVISGTFSTALNTYSGNVKFVATNPEPIVAGSSKTYRLRVALNGIMNSGDAVISNIQTGTAGKIQSTTEASAESNATFTWSDESTAPNGVVFNDWNNDFLVKSIPTDSQALTF